MQAAGQVEAGRGAAWKSASLWLAAAVASGAIAGLAATSRAGMLVLAAVVGATAFAAVVRKPHLGVYLIVALVPLDIYGRIISRPVPLTLYQLALALALAAWWVRAAAEPGRWVRFAPVDVGCAMLVAAAFASAVWSVDPPSTLRAGVRVLFAWLLALFTANVLTGRKRFRFAYAVLLGTAVLHGAIGFAQQFVPGFDLGRVRVYMAAGGRVNFVRASGFFEDPNMFAGFLAASFVAGLAFVVHSSTRRELLVWSIATAVTGAGLLATLSRTGWVTAALGAVVVALTAPPRRRMWIVTAGLVGVLGLTAVAPGTVATRAASIFDTERDESNRTRYGMYQSTIEMIRDDWVLGTGLAAYEKVYPAYRKPGTSQVVVKPHQLPLSFWAEMGVLGLAVEMVLALGVWMLFWPRRGRPWSVYEGAALAGLVSLLAGSLFQYYLYFEYLWLFLAFAVAASRLGAGVAIGFERGHDG
ncbi:O-antigen ligase family protein [Coriobacteriia bacterium Es71-Z0120]|uniref:O-antigen ligase family protein n=1 Tax=Parvivirga hydrogeniphila TaxID=2939460 RepID=UPI0022608B55|nr:O-antigen ligase family protein [Parvivirga hydrogeniphila]MCL4078788.1 O-antigen ligase family protein [Parvivirga hydrogeniphila]